MLASATRKLKQLAADPVLRRYLAGRALGRWPALPLPSRSTPPYVTAIPSAAVPKGHWPELAAGAAGEAVLPLPGTAVTAASDLFDRDYCDGETLSALHRFAWVPLMGSGVDAGGVAALWRRWRDRFATPDDGPAWEAYTAAERAINLLDLGRRLGLPGPVDDTLAVLAAHAPAIARRMEYFGEHATHNHLANNGRGLYRLGADLGMPEWADLGALILEKEAQRLILGPGVLREGSSHYHLLYIRNFADCWLAARRAGRPEEGQWRALLERMFAVLARLALPGGLPLVGDISPDSPPRFLGGLLPGGDMAQGWTGLLPEDERQALGSLRDGAGLADLAGTGWLRADFGEWCGLWHAAPEGWCFSPGHGHQDVGAFELHCRGVPVFIDPGRGAYGEEGEAALYRSGAVHGGLQVDGADPYPVNKPYYAPEFRRAIGGANPALEAGADGVRLTFDGFARLGGVGRVERRWHFQGGGFDIEDMVAGSGGHRVTRRLVTPHEARLVDGAVLVEVGAFRLKVSADAPLVVRPAKRWVAYGEAAPAWAIEAEASVRLPWSGRFAVEVV